MKNFLSIDQGTTSSRSIIFDSNLKLVKDSQKEYDLEYPNDGWVELKPENVIETVLETLEDVLSGNHDIEACGITNQRETTIVWSKLSGEPIYPGIVWQDRRTENYCNKLKEKNLVNTIQMKTGLVIDPYFSATKIKWIIENIKEAKESLSKGNLLVGTIDTWLIWNFTKGSEHSTDVTNASRTMLYNIAEDKWDEDLLDIFALPNNILPYVKSSVDDFGKISSNFFGNEIQIGGVAGDQQAASVGQSCFKEGMVKSTYGTGCFLLMNTGDNILNSQSNLLSTVAYNIKGKKSYAIEGSIFNAGTVVQWMRDELEFFNNTSDVESLASKSSNDIHFVPAFTGLGAPYWIPEARGIISGLTRDTGQNEIVRAALQSVVYQSKDLLDAMKDDGLKPSLIKVDGGMTQNDWFNQFLADVSTLKVLKPKKINNKSSHKYLVKNKKTLANDPCYMTYTSGTTGRPKGVLHAHRSIIGREPSTKFWLNLKQEDVVFNPGKLNWTYTLGAGCLDCLRYGSTVVIYSGKHNTNNYLEIINNLKITIFMTVPGVYRQILREITADLRKIKKLKRVKNFLCAGEHLKKQIIIE